MTAAVRDGLPPPQRGRAALVIMLGISLSVLDGSIMNLALPGIARELNVGASQSIWVVNAYQIASLIMLLPLAALGERLGYRRIYLVGMALFMLSSVAAMLADSLVMLIAARSLQGLGAAGVMSVNSALVRLVYPSARLGRGISLNAMVVATSTMAGPAIAAAILSVASWHWLFALNIPLGLFTLWMGRRNLPANPPSSAPSAQFSWFDVLLNMLMFSLVFVGADHLGVRMGADSSASALGWWLLAGGVAVGALYLRRQWRLTTPLFPLDLLRIPVFALSMGGSVSAFCAQMLAFLSTPFLLLEVLGRTHMQAGLIMTAWPLATVAVAPIAGRLIGRFPAGWLGGIGMAVFAAGLLSLGWLPAQPSNLELAARLALCGGGFALFQSPNNHTIVTAAPLHRAGAASGMLSTARLTGQTLGAVLLAVIYAVWDAHDGRGEAIAFSLAAASAVLAGVCSSLRVRAGPPSSPSSA